MPQSVLILTTAATVMLLIVAAFFCGDSPVDLIDIEGMDRYREGQYAEALAVWQQGLDEHPDSPQLYYRIGTLLAVRGNFRKAASYLEKAVEITPESSEFRRELALCYLQDERTEDAECELNEIIRRTNWFPGAHYHLATIYEKRGDREAALKEYVAELNFNPSSTYAWAKVHTWENDETNGQ